MRTLLLVLCLLTIPASAAAQQTQTASASEVLCAKFEALDHVSRGACKAYCASWPIHPDCWLLRRYGYNGQQLAQRIGAGVDWPTIQRQYPHMREALEYHYLANLNQLGWLTAETQRLTLQTFPLMMSAIGAIQEGRYSDALNASQQAEASFSKIFGPAHPIVSHATDLRALSLLYLGRYEEAAAATTLGIQRVEQTLGDEIALLGTLLETQSTARYSLGDPADARRSLQRALSVNLTTQGPRNLSRVGLLSNLSTMMLREGDLDLALTTAHDALALIEQLPGTPPRFTPPLLNNIASIHEQRGELELARQAMTRALKLMEAAYGDAHPELIGFLHNFALFLTHTGDLEQAQLHLERARAICERTVGVKHPLYATTLAHLAQITSQRGDHAAARALATSALKLHEELLGATHPDLALPLATLAELSIDAGAFADALPLYERAIAIEERAYKEPRPQLVRLLIGHALAALRSADRDAALRSTDRAVKLHERLPHMEPLQAAETLEAASILYAALAQRDPWSLLERGAALRREAFWRTVQAADSDTQLLQLASMDRRNQDVFLEIAHLQQRRLALWSALLEHTGRAARAEQLRRGWLHTLAQRPKSADAAWTAYQDAERALRAEQARAAAAPAAEPARLTDAARALKAAEAALDKKWPARRQARDAALVSADATCAILRAERAAMIHWVRRPPLPMLRPDTQDRWLAVVVTPAGQGCAITPVDLGLAPPIDAALTTWRDAVQQVEQRLTQRKPPQQAKAAMHAAGEALYQQLWAPLAPALGDVKRAYLVPQDRLLEVAFGALIQPDGQPLLSRVALAYLPIPAALTAPATRASAPGRGALVVGALDFAASPDADASRWQRCRSGGCQRAPQAALAQAATRAAGGSACGWRALQWPSVGAEAIRVAEALGARWRDQEIWLVTGASARQDALEAHMPGKRVLHFGTHGFFAPAKGCEGQVQHTRAGLLDSAPMRVGLDPMQLSALVLSGANTAAAAAASHLDGALTAREIVALDLSAVEVATLAACETGRGEQVAGEGAQGLSKAFVVAGVREVIVSLWRVPDQETARLMLDLYAALPAKPAPGQATRALIASQRKLAADLAAAGDAHSAFLWAAFIPIVSQPAFGAP